MIGPVIMGEFIDGLHPVRSPAIDDVIGSKCHSPIKLVCTAGHDHSRPVCLSDLDTKQ